MPSSRLFERAIAAGATVTAQRKTVCGVLEASSDHPDAEVILQRVRKQDSKISLATVYRTLKTLTELQLVSAHDFGDSRMRFEVKEVEHHDHLIDLHSGEVLEFYDAELEALKHKIAARLGYKLESHSLELYGHSISAKTELVGRRDPN
ncbi:MAG: transcriptional repressor [Pseudomonadota bacterium]